jgi:hypothetical protein
MHHNIKKIIFTISIVVVLITSVLGQTIPASGVLEKRNFDYLTDQHLTARLGNNKVCGDHMCAAGEWTKLQENLNKAQIGHSLEKNIPNTTSSLTLTVNSISSTTKMNSTSTTSTPTVPPVPVPIPTPSATPYSVCKAIKETLANSTVSSDVVAKILADLNCR